MFQHLFEGSPLKKSITIYIILIIAILYLQPNFLFEENGNIRNFGLKNENTIMPLPMLFVIMAILIYLFCLIM